MAKIKKVVFLILAILSILIFTNNTFASTIQPKNDTGNTSGNTSSNAAENSSNNNTSAIAPANNTSNNTSINAANNTSNTSNSLTGSTNNVTTQINTTNTSQNLPDTGIDSTYLNFAFIILLALVLGMFSLVQYNKIIKKENE